MPIKISIIGDSFIPSKVFLTSLKKHLKSIRPKIQIQFFTKDFKEEKLLQEKGYKLYPSSTMGSVQAILKDGEYFYGAADPRRPGSGAVAP